jgi:hypothetical protein
MLALYAVLYWVFALTGGDTYWYGLAIAATVAFVGMQIRGRLIHRSGFRRV